MKKILKATIVILALVSNSQAGSVGSSFGCLTTAHAIGQGKGNFLGGVGIADATSVFGRFDYGLSAYTTGGLKLGLVDADGADTKLTLGADFRYQFMSTTGAKGVKQNPLDMAFGGFFEYADFGSVSAMQIGGQLLGSLPMTLQGGTVLTPYGRFVIRLESIDRDSGSPGKSGSNSELEFGLNGGVKWELSRTMNMYFEFQLDGNDGLFFGLEFPIM